jgi:hypothetical protein
MRPAPRREYTETGSLQRRQLRGHFRMTCGKLTGLAVQQVPSAPILHSDDIDAINCSTTEQLVLVNPRTLMDKNQYEPTRRACLTPQQFKKINRHVDVVILT